MSERPRVLVIGDDAFPFHAIEEKGPLFADVLGDVCEVSVTADRDRLTDLSGVDVVVDYTTDNAWAEAQRDGLLAHVEAGGGYVGVHGAADLTSYAPDDPDEVIAHDDEPNPAMRDLMGGIFLTHPENGIFTVEPVADHPITDGVDAFEVYDEPYQVEWDDHVAVLARMDHPDLDDYPVVWENPAPAGRVCYLSLGHTDEAFETDGFRRLLRNAVGWAADGD